MTNLPTNSLSCLVCEDCPDIECDDCGTSRIACVLHPRAREYLMRDVVEELEKRDCESLGCGYNIKITCREAIALIRNGVQR